MTLTKIVGLINKRLAGEQFVYSELEAFLDDAIDQINTRLDAAYPTFSEFNSTDHASYPDYNFFPDKYIRMVVTPMAAAGFYSVDEEGAGGAQDYKMEAMTNLFLMERDWSQNVPVAYQAPVRQGHFPAVADQERGMEFYGEF